MEKRRLLTPSLILTAALVLANCGNDLRAPVQENTATDCHEGQEQNAAWTYCITKTKGSANPDILYYLHGGGGNARTWAESSENQAIRAAWESSDKNAPTVIAVSFGPAWLLAEKNESAASGLMETFIDRVLPETEKDLGTLKGQRLLFGVSMGGFNVSQLVLKHPDKFARAVMGCPGISNVSIYASEEEIQDYIKRTGANEALVKQTLDLAKRFYPNEESWKKASPVALAQTVLSSSSPALHVSCGRQDEYGFFEGAKLFAEAAETNGVRTIVWQPLAGGHCVMDLNAVANFLVTQTL